MTTDSPSLSTDEIAKFAALAKEWWDPAGPFKPLHKMNPIRLDYLKAQICAHFYRDPAAPNPLKGLKVVDVGCGGGLLSEPLARLGAMVTGIDAAAEGIEVAKAHASAMGLEIEYRAITADALAAEGVKFDVVTAMEIIEHVPNRTAFLTQLSYLLKPEGLAALSTLNRTPQSYAKAILGAEYILRWLPVGTHDWEQFPTPDELSSEAKTASLRIVDTVGFSFNPLLDTWKLSDDLSVNYGVVALPAHTAI